MTDVTPAGAGTLGIGDDGTFRIHFDRVLSHPAQAVWAALIDPAKLTVWMPGSRIEAKVGGAVCYDFGDEGRATGVVVSLRAPSVANPTAELEHTWHWEGLPVSMVAWRLEPAEGGTHLSLTHREVVREPAAEFAMGWHIILDTLDRYVGDRPLDGVWDDYDALADLYMQA